MIIGQHSVATAQQLSPLLDRAGQGIYDYLFQAPLLVVLVGLAFTFCVAPGLVEDLETEEPRGTEG